MNLFGVIIETRVFQVLWKGWNELIWAKIEAQLKYYKAKEAIIKLKTNFWFWLINYILTSGIPIRDCPAGKPDESSTNARCNGNGMHAAQRKIIIALVSIKFFQINILTDLKSENKKLRRLKKTKFKQIKLARNKKSNLNQALCVYLYSNLCRRIFFRSYLKFIYVFKDYWQGFYVE